MPSATSSGAASLTEANDVKRTSSGRRPRTFDGTGRHQTTPLNGTYEPCSRTRPTVQFSQGPLQGQGTVLGHRAKQLLPERSRLPESAAGRRCNGDPDQLERSQVEGLSHRRHEGPQPGGSRATKTARPEGPAHVPCPVPVQGAFRAGFRERPQVRRAVHLNRQSRPRWTKRSSCESRFPEISQILS